MKTDKEGNLILTKWHDLGMLLCCDRIVWPLPRLWAGRCLKCDTVTWVGFGPREDK